MQSTKCMLGILALIWLAMTVEANGQKAGCRNGHLYWWVRPGTIAEVRQDARAFMLTTGLKCYLATIDDAAESSYLRQQLGRSLIWLGLSDEYSEGNWVWDSGKPVTFTRWGVNQPTGVGYCQGYVVPTENEDHVETYALTEDWNDLDGTCWERESILEIEPCLIEGVYPKVKPFSIGNIEKCRYGVAPSGPWGKSDACGNRVEVAHVPNLEGGCGFYCTRFITADGEIRLVGVCPFYGPKNRWYFEGVEDPNQTENPLLWTRIVHMSTDRYCDDIPELNGPRLREQIQQVYDVCKNILTVYHNKLDPATGQIIGASIKEYSGTPPTNCGYDFEYQSQIDAEYAMGCDPSEHMAPWGVRGVADSTDSSEVGDKDAAACSITLNGSANGGKLTFFADVSSISITTYANETANAVATRLAEAIRLSPSIKASCCSEAIAIGNQINLGGVGCELIGVDVEDSGISETPSPESLSVESTLGGNMVKWTNPIQYDAIYVRRNGILLLESGSGQINEVLDGVELNGPATYWVVGWKDGTPSKPARIDMGLIRTNILPNVLCEGDNDGVLEVMVEPQPPMNLIELDLASVRLNETLQQDTGYTTILGDSDDNGIPDAVVHFSKTEALDLLEPSDGGTVIVRGVHGGSEFAVVSSLQRLDPDCGDCNCSMQVDISDAVSLINYIFASGVAPLGKEKGDVNCSGRTDITDAVYLINFIFAGGAVPCSLCP